MKSKYKILLFSIISLCLTFVTGFTEVSAATLVREQVPNVYYARSGGGKPYGTHFVENYTMDGKAVYCIEPGVAITTDTYIGKEGWINSPFNDEINKRMQLVGYYGYDYPTHKTQRFRLATQAIIWEIASGQTIELWTEIGGYGDYINIDYERNEIMKLVNAHYNNPSFKDETKSGILGQEVLFEDTNNLLSNYEVYSSVNATTTIEGNILKVVPNTVGKISVDLVRKTYTNEPTILFVGNDGISQKMGYFGLNDPLLVRVNVEAIGGDVAIRKVDSDTLKSVPQGTESSLKDAEYGVFNYSDTLITTLKTDSQGYAKSDILPDIGSFYIKELKASKGYELDNTKYYFTINADNLHPTVEVYEQVINRNVEINKYYVKNETGTLLPEKEIEFAIYDSKNNHVKTIKTNSQGFTSTNLVYGNYVVKQLNTLPGYEKVKDFKVVVNSESPEVIKYSLTNAPITARLKLVKIDSESKKVIPYEGVTFKLKNVDTGEYVCQKVNYPKKEEICEFKTSSDGIFYTANPLMSGTYQIEEVKSPKNYLLSKDYVTFRIDENSNFVEDDEYGKYVEVTFANDKVKGEIHIEKLGESFKVLDSSFKYEDIPLKGVEFALYAYEDIITLDGVKHYSKGDLIKKISTDSTGRATFSDLHIGKYVVKEEKTINNYIKDTKEYVIELTSKDNVTAIVNETLNIKNKLKKGTFELTKLDLVDGTVIPNTLLEVYTENDELIFSGLTSEEGKISITGLCAGQKYYLIEKMPATGFVITDEIIEFEILEDGTIIKAEMTNKPIMGTLELSKIDLSTSEPLPNTLFQIYTEDDELVFEGRTDSEGMLVVENLRHNKYYILEREAPENYILNEEKMYFEIKEDGEIVKATVVNEKVVIEVPITGTTANRVIRIIGSVVVIIGLGVMLYATKKDKRK